MNKEQAEPGPGRDEESVRETETTAPRAGHCRTTDVSSFKGMLHGGGGKTNGAVNMTFSLSVCVCVCGCARGHEIASVSSTCHPRYCGYLLKKEVSWMKPQHEFCLLGVELCFV